jgi:hypothetical protein
MPSYPIVIERLVNRAGLEPATRCLPQIVYSVRLAFTGVSYAPVSRCLGGFWTRFGLNFRLQSRKNCKDRTASAITQSGFDA